MGEGRRKSLVVCENLLVRPVNTVFFALIPECGKAHFQHLSSVSPISPRLMHCLAEQVGFKTGDHLVKRHFSFAEAAVAGPQYQIDSTSPPYFRGQIFLPDLVAYKKREPLDDVPQFPNIAGPGVPEELIHCLLRYGQLLFGSVTMEEISNEKRDVISSVPEGRYYQWNDIDAVVEIGAEPPLFGKFLQIHL